MATHRYAVAAAIAFTLSCAAPRYEYRGTSAAPRALCDSTTVAASAPAGFEKIGTLVATDNCSTTLEDFLPRVRDLLCRVGGDAVVPEFQGYWRCYIRAAVYRRLAQTNGVTDGTDLQSRR